MLYTRHFSWIKEVTSKGEKGGAPKQKVIITLLVYTPLHDKAGYTTAASLVNVCNITLFKRRDSQLIKPAHRALVEHTTSARQVLVVSARRASFIV